MAGRRSVARCAAIALRACLAALAGTLERSRIAPAAATVRGRGTIAAAIRTAAAIPAAVRSPSTIAAPVRSPGTIAATVAGAITAFCTAAKRLARIGALALLAAAEFLPAPLVPVLHAPAVL